MQNIFKNFHNDIKFCRTFWKCLTPIKNKSKDLKEEKCNKI